MYKERFTAADILSLDIVKVVHDPNCVDVEAFDGAFRKAAKDADEQGDQNKARAFRLLYALVSFHFKPEDKIEPFSNMAAFEDGTRTLVGSDFDQQDIDELAEAALKVEPLALRVRIADLVWSRDKSRQAHARLAIDGYREMVERVSRGEGTLRFEKSTATGVTTQNFLKRAFVIARSIGWDRAENAELKQTFLNVLEQAISEAGYALVRFGNLGLDYNVDGTTEALVDLEPLARATCDNGEFHEAVGIQELANRIIARANQGEVSAEARLALANIYERKADASAKSSFLQTHALQQAIDALHGAKGVREERQRLHDRLKDAQLHFADEMGSFSHSTDISDEVERLLKGYEGLDLLECLKRLAFTELPQSPEKMFEHARKEAEEFPLSSLFATSILDQKGRTIARTSDGFGESEALRHKVIQHFGIKTSLAVSAAISPARSFITSNFRVDESLLSVLCDVSPFVPHGQELQVARGLQAFLYEDEIVAGSILIPFLESGLRNLVSVAGRADTTISLGGIEKTIGLGRLLSDHREVLEKVFGESQIFAIDNLFIHELGPKVRHEFCHGMAFDGSFYAHHYIYACKLIFSLTIMPITSEAVWSQIKSQIDQRFGLSSLSYTPLAH